MGESVAFYDISVWRSILLTGILLGSLLLAHILKCKGPLKNSLLPNAVLGGIIVLIVSTVLYYTTGNYLFNQSWLSADESGMNTLEILTYHCLAVGFIAMTLRDSDNSKVKGRLGEVIDSGLLTIGSYLVQGITGVIITIIAAVFISGFVPGSGMLLCFAFSQGTGQALTQGANFDAAAGTGEVYANMGLALAAAGFLIASLGGVIILNILKRRKIITVSKAEGYFSHDKSSEKEPGAEEMSSNEGVDRLSIQFSLIAVTYLLAYAMMFVLGKLISGMAGTIYGFNYLFGVIAAVIVKAVLKVLKKKGIVKKQYNNTFLLNRISGFAFDLMIVSGICAIQIHLLIDYVWVFVILVVIGTIVTFLYIWYVSKKIFPDVRYEQFFGFFGMLTGTASTGVILLREIDPRLESKAAENLVYQNIPAIILALPLLVVASMLYSSYEAAMNIPRAIIIIASVAVYFIILNIILFRKYIFKKKKVKVK